jgi:hypothetical protein
MGPVFGSPLESRRDMCIGDASLRLSLPLFASLRVQQTARRRTRGTQLLAPGSIRQSRCSAWGARVGLFDHLLHVQEAAHGDKKFVRGGSVVAGLNASADAVVQGLTYTFVTPVLGGQAAISVLGAPRHVAPVSTPHRPGREATQFQAPRRTTFADVFYQGTLKWNQGVTTR